MNRGLCTHVWSFFLQIQRMLHNASKNYMKLSLYRDRFQGQFAKRVFC